MTRAGLNRKNGDSLFPALSALSDSFERHESSTHYCVFNGASEIAKSQEVVFPQVGSTRDDRSK